MSSQIYLSTSKFHHDFCKIFKEFLKKLKKNNFSNFFSEAMRANPELYAQLKDKTTKLGVNLGHCIKTGIDNKGTIFEGF